MIVRIRVAFLGVVLLSACEPSTPVAFARGPAGDTLAIDSLAVLPSLTLNEKYIASSIEDTLHASRILNDSLGFIDVTLLSTVGENLIAVDQFSSPHIAIINSIDGSIRDRLGGYGIVLIDIGD